MTKNKDKIVLVFSRKELERKCTCCYVNEKNKCDMFLEQKDLVERKETFISMIGFLMNDIYVMLRGEMHKRKRIESIQQDIERLQQKMNKT